MKKASVILMFMLAVGLCACNDVKAEEIGFTTVYVRDNGSIVATIVEDFSQPQYDASELETMATDEIAAYNASVGDEKVEMTFYEVEGSIAKMQMEYTDAEAYEAFNHEDIFVGTVEEALAEGYDLNVTLVNPTDVSQTIGEHELLTMQDSNIVIVENAVRVRIESVMLYMSADAKYIDEHEADGYDNPDATIIVY